jgi:predicted 3-demethylubiquinone-9 3-methyltransferase (glyoxalase superfamily)
MDKLGICLWFDGNGEDAVEFYTRVFDDVTVTGRGGLTIEFTMSGTRFIALNGGPHFTFNEAISFVIDCDDQAEVDRYWDALLDGGTPSQCGWLKDRFGVSWQVVPKRLYELMASDDAAAAQRAIQAMLGMVKLDVAALEAAYASL